MYRITTISQSIESASTAILAPDISCLRPHTGQSSYQPLPGASSPTLGVMDNTIRHGAQELQLLRLRPFWQRLLLFSLLPMLPPGYEDHLGQHTCSSGRRRPPRTAFLTVSHARSSRRRARHHQTSRTVRSIAHAFMEAADINHNSPCLKTLEPCQVDARGSQTALRGQAHSVNITPSLFCERLCNDHSLHSG